jgi:hypothetical protein
MAIVNEPGLYAMVFRSNKPAAKCTHLVDETGRELAP